LTAGRLLQTAQPWLQQHLQPESAPVAMVDKLHKPVVAFTWLIRQLAALQQHPTAAAAAASVPPKLLQELEASASRPRVAALSFLFNAAKDPLQASSAADTAVYDAVLQACAEGWLPQALQQLGSKVWAAWPQKYACNDDLCLNLDCLTEDSCGKSKCNGCKVRRLQL
jgi:hypothetical protein